MVAPGGGVVLNERGTPVPDGFVNGSVPEPPRQLWFETCGVMELPNDNQLAVHTDLLTSRLQPHNGL